MSHTACTRKIIKTYPQLKHQFKQSTADTLYNKADFEVLNSQTQPAHFINKDLLEDNTITIRTNPTGTPVKISSTAGEVKIDSSISFVNQYYLIGYTVQSKLNKKQELLSKLLGNIKDFKGFPNTTYRIVPSLRKNYLVLYRVAKKSQIPYDEYSSAITLNNELIAAPLVGYPIKYCKAEVLKNDDYEDTGQYRPKCEDISQKSAEYIQFNQIDKNVFQYEPKMDYFPSDFFNGKWFFTETVIATNENASLNRIHTGFQMGTLVEFKKEPERLLAVESSGINIEDKDKQRTIAIPIEWEDHSFDFSDKKATFKEKMQDKIRDINRPYFKILFNKLLGENSGTTLKDIKITDDYFSYAFDIEQHGTLVTLQIAFMKEKTDHTNHPEKQWIASNHKDFFSTFFTERQHYVSADEHTTQDINHYRRVTRFNPNNKVIKWHFSKNSTHAPWIRQLVRHAVALWDKAFSKAAEGTGKTPIRIVLDESKEVDLGDLHFNIINMVEMKSDLPSGLLGYGPSISHPITGEVIAGTANIYVNPILTQYINIIRGYIRFHLFPPIWKWLPNSPGVSTYLHERIQQLCPEVATFIKNNQNIKFLGQNTIIDDKSITRQCAITMAREEMLSTILHEMGHTFSLMHNYTASVDTKNMYESYEEIKAIFGDNILNNSTPSHPKPAYFSSVMDYGLFTQPLLTVPGKYDIDAIRFIYYDRVQTQDGSMIKVANNPNKDTKSILQIANKQGKKVKKYAKCGKITIGHIVLDGDQDNPFCEQFDYGKTSEQIIKNHIIHFKNLMMRELKFYDTNKDTERHVFRFFNQAQYLGDVIGKWITAYTKERVQLTSGKHITLPIYSENNEEYINTLENTAKHNSNFKQYYDVKKLLFDFFKEVISLPTQTCFFATPDDDTYYNFSLIRIKRYISTNFNLQHSAIISSCQSPLVLNAAKQMTKQTDLQFVTEIGFPPIRQSYSVPIHIANDLDEHSIFMNNIYAPVLMSLSNILEEPDLKVEVLDKIFIPYMLKGNDITPYHYQFPKSAPPPPKYIESYFSDELIFSAENGLNSMPGSTHERLKSLRKLFLFQSIFFSLDRATQNEYEQFIKKYSCKIIPDKDIDDNFMDRIQRPYFQNQVPYIKVLLNKFNTQYPKLTKYRANAFTQFLHEQKDVFHTEHSNKHILCIPYSGENNNVLINIIKKYNKIRQCTNTKKAQSSYCENTKNKQLILNLIEKYILIVNAQPALLNN